jgi:hypothetical protein
MVTYDNLKTMEELLMGHGSIISNRGSFSFLILIQFNSIQFFIIYVPSQQLQGQLQTQHRVDTGNYIMEQYNIKSKINCRQVLEKKHINAEK